MVDSKKLSELLAILHRGRMYCVETIDSLINSELNTETKIPKENEFRELFSRVTEIVGSILNEFLNNIWDSESVHDGDRKFYIWPGYFKYSPYSSGRLDSQEYDLNKIILEKFPDTIKNQDNTFLYKNILDIIYNKSTNHGYGFINNIKISCCPLHIWFYLFYGQPIGEYTIHGFTKWFEMNGTLFLNNEFKNCNGEIPVKDEDLTPLIAIEFTSDSLKKRGHIINNGVLTIFSSEKNKPIKLLNDYTSVLNNFSKFYIRKRENKSSSIAKSPISYSYPPFSIGSNETVSVKGNLCLGKNKIIKDSLDHIFSLLLYSIFYEQKENIISNYIEKIISTQNQNKISGLEQFTKRLKIAKELLDLAPDYKEKSNNVSFEPITFKNYYVIPMAPSLKIIGTYKMQPYIGTMNIYTEHSIKPVYLSIIKEWLESIYEHIRQVEALVNTEKTSARKQIEAFNHESKRLVDALELSLVKFTNYFTINEKKQTFHLKNNVNNDLIKKISKFYIVPYPEITKLIAFTINSWGGLKDIPKYFGFDRNSSLLALLKCLNEHAKKLSAITRYINYFNLQNEERKSFFLKKYNSELNKLNNINFIFKNSQYNLTWLPNGDIDRQNGFTQLMLSTMKNCYENIPENKQIQCEITIDEQSLSFLFSNNIDQDKPSSNSKKDGTQAVLEICLDRLGSQLCQFGESEKKWKTEFAFQFKSIFDSN